MNDQIFSIYKQEFNAGNTAKAIEVLEAENRNKPNDYVCLYHLGFAYRMAGDLKKAEKYYLEALNIEPNDDLANVGLGVVYQLKGDFNKAIDYLQKAITISPYNSNAYNSLGLTYKKRGDLDIAAETYLKGIKGTFDKLCDELLKKQIRKLVPHKETTSTEWHKLAIEAILKQAANEKGIEKFLWPTGESALKFYEEGKDSDCWIDSKGSRYMTPQYLEVVRETISSTLQYSILTNNLANVFAEQGKKDEARKWFMESIAFIPEGADYQNPIIGLKNL